MAIMFLCSVLFTILMQKVFCCPAVVYFTSISEFSLNITQMLQISYICIYIKLNYYILYYVPVGLTTVMDFVKEDFVSYGCMSDNLPDCERSKRPFYITTAIAYTNGFPHMGLQQPLFKYVILTVYIPIISDTISRILF